MTVHLVTFSDESMIQSALLCELSAKVNGADSTAIWNPYRLTVAGFYQNSIEQVVKSARRGCNYWQWKPFIIAQEMLGSPDGSFLIYSDAGVEFLNNVSHIIDRMDQDIFLFGNQYEHAHWCKRDIVEAVWPLELNDIPDNVSDDLTFGEFWRDKGWGRFGKQVQASVIFFRVNDRTRAFVKEWFDWCLFEGGRLIDDSPSRTPNHPEFQENRHDQAILTTMAYRDGIKLHWWPASYNDGTFTYPKGEFTDDYPVLFNHHRRRNHEWPDYQAFKAECDAKIDAVLDSIPGLERVS